MRAASGDGGEGGRKRRTIGERFKRGELIQEAAAACVRWITGQERTEGLVK